MKVLSSDKYVFAMDKDNEPVLTINSGDKVRVETMDCFSNTVRSQSDVVSEIDFSRVNPATGPIYVEEAKAGDTLKVTIHSIEIDDQAATICMPGLGVLADEVPEENTVILPIKDEKVYFKGVGFPLKKMVGVIGVAPSGDPVETGTPANHGGNMDSNTVTEGTSVYLPVGVDGALLALGDLHAAMGDGEVGGAAAEIAGAVEITVEVLKDFPITSPMLESDKRWTTIGSAETLEEASQIAVRDMVNFIENRTNLNVKEIMSLLTVVGDLRVCQAVNPQVTMRMEIDKTVVDSNYDE